MTNVLGRWAVVLLLDVLLVPNFEKIIISSWKRQSAENWVQMSWYMMDGCVLPATDVDENSRNSCSNVPLVSRSVVEQLATYRCTAKIQDFSCLYLFVRICIGLLYTWYGFRSIDCPLWLVLMLRDIFPARPERVRTSRKE